MVIKFLGTGGAFDYPYGNSAAWIQFKGQHLLLDCGNTVYAKLRELDLADRIDYILITHCHDDHIGSLSTYILHHHFLGKPARKARILVPDPDFEEHLAELLRFSIPDPYKYLQFIPVGQLSGIKPIPTFGKHVWGMRSYGYLFEDEEEILVYSGDIGESESIFHAIPPNALKPVRVFHDLSFEKGDGVHTYYQSLVPWTSQYNIYGYHTDPSLAPPDNSIPLVANIPELNA